MRQDSAITSGLFALAAMLLAFATIADACPTPGTTSGTLSAGPWLLAADSRAMGVGMVPAVAGKTLLVQYKRHDGTGDPLYAVVPPVPAGGAVATHVWLRNLTADTEYDYEVWSGGLRDTDAMATFRTPPTEGTPIAATIAHVSCFDSVQYPNQVGWTTLAAQSPKLIISVGDFTYANTTNLTTHRTKYTAQFQVPEFAALVKTVPIAGIYDDHDFHSCADGWGGCSQPGVDNALTALDEFLPTYPGLESSIDGGTQYLRFGDVSIYLQDGRRHRSQDSATDDMSKSIPGVAQWAETYAMMQAWQTTTTWHLIADGSSIERSPSDGYRVFTYDRDERLFALTLDFDGVVHLSGDLHANYQEKFSAGWAATLQYAMWDIISSGIGPSGAAQTYSYVTVLEIDTTLPDPRIVVKPLRTRHSDGVTVNYVGNEQVVVDGLHLYRTYGTTILLSETHR